ncbi:MAG: DUF2917 domain-containing protein [Gammaproteobacteria bacterium]|nr:DUF2917 domain-containing protein [Rhodocyclaceae bacterium]MBU3908065.1 DUF2917 domain-containing protein [Gammaproteobacteria bacterium]MBU3990324.1 DUF2917 domain-containing protein [Gammaproteobacteria bacterium]MBU4006022.1 DUF2917 domain-containing protein [Gammaproteobacteria bacterium]MBU4022005.1 DUF2917 domain-containing protein [Gammaproteobacteria bacterium]
MTTRELALQHNRPLRIEAIEGVVLVKCVAGTVWLTSADRPGDVFLRAGESLAVHGYGLTLIEALGAARVVLQPPRPHWMRAITVAKRMFLLSSLHERMRTVRFPRWRNPLAG